MQFLGSFLLGSAVFLSSTFALPASSRDTLDRRTCGTTYPTSMIEVTPFYAGKTDSDFCVDNTKVRYVHFDIPSTARGACQLEFVFPADYSVGNPESRQLNVWKTSRSFDITTDTWTSSPQITALFGTVTLKSKRSEQSRIIVNSGDCSSMKDFKFVIAENSNNATINYQQKYYEAGSVAGVRIVHSC